MKPSPSLLRAACLACCVAFLVAACGVLPERENVQVWQPETHALKDLPNGDFSLRVDAPNTTGLLTQSGIVVMPSPGQVSTYKGARWSDLPSLLVRQRLVDAFMAAKLPAVTNDGDGFSSDFTLSGNLRDFQAEYRDGRPVVVIRFDAQLRRGGSRRLLATRSFVVTEHPSGTQVPQVVAAFGAAEDALAAQVVPWVVEQVRALPPPDADNDSSR